MARKAKNNAAPKAATGEKSTKSSPLDGATLGLLALVVLLGFGLRVWGIGWSLPNAAHPLATYHPDEAVNLGASQQADIAHGKFDIQFYNYGAFYFYLANLGQTVGRGYHLIRTTPPASADAPSSTSIAEAVRRAPEMAGLYLAGRWVTLLMGVASIPVLFALGHRLYGRSAGLLTALLYAIAPLAVVHAHFMTVDVPATLFVSLALLWSARLLTSAPWKDVLIAGVWVGLAGATKYNTVLVLAAPIAAVCLNPGAKADRWAKLAGLLGIVLLTFLIACPGPWLNWNVFWNGTYPGSGVRYELFDHSRQGHGDLFTNTGIGWWYHLRISLYYGLGPPLLLLTLCGLIYALVRRERGDLTMLAFLLLYYFAVGLSAVRFARYLIPLYPVLCLFAARLLTAKLTRGTQIAVRGLGAGAVALTATLSLIFSHVMASPDARDMTANRLNRNAPRGSSVAFATIPWFYSPPLSPWFGALSAGQRLRAVDETTRYTLRISDKEWDTSVFQPTPDYVLVSSFETANAVNRLHKPEAVRFMQAIPLKLDLTLHASMGLSASVPLDDDNCPEDLRYILPRIAIYARK